LSGRKKLAKILAKIEILQKIYTLSEQNLLESMLYSTISENLVFLAVKVFEKILFIPIVIKNKNTLRWVSLFFCFAKILLTLLRKKLLIENYYLHWYEIFLEACRMSILHPLKILNLHLKNFLRK